MTSLDSENLFNRLSRAYEILRSKRFLANFRLDRAENELSEVDILMIFAGLTNW